MDYKREIEELQRRIDNNAVKIIDNFNRISKNEGKIDDHLEKIQKNSYALDILKDYKAETKRIYTVLIIVLCMWFITIGVLIFGKLL